MDGLQPPSGSGHVANACQKIVQPQVVGALSPPPMRPCKGKHFADGWCKLHHPRLVAERQARMDALNRERLETRNERIKANHIGRAIALLMTNGYKVEKLPT